MKGTIKIWISFALRAILIHLLFFLLTSLNSFFLLRDQIPRPISPSLWLPLFSILIPGFLLSSFLTAWVSKRLFHPIEDLSSAMNQVAEGNFNVQLSEEGANSQIRQMNCNFNKMVRELNTTQVLHSDFVRNISHEIKTPLAAMEGYALLLEEAELPVPGELHSYAEKIVESSRQLSTLTGNILRLSRLEHQEILSCRQLFSLDEQIRQALLSLEPLWTKKNLEIDMELPAADYWGDPDLLYQVWINLFSNAIKFTPEGGTISVCMEQDSGSVTIHIRDTGTGMTPQVQKHIFEKFYQGDSSRHMEGNGLGLALVKRIVDLYGGTIQVESAPGEGSCFSVTLPHFVPQSL